MSIYYHVFPQYKFFAFPMDLIYLLNGNQCKTYVHGEYAFEAAGGDTGRTGTSLRA